MTDKSGGVSYSGFNRYCSQPCGGRATRGTQLMSNYQRLTIVASLIAAVVLGILISLVA